MRFLTQSAPEPRIAGVRRALLRMSHISCPDAFGIRSMAAMLVAALYAAQFVCVFALCIARCAAALVALQCGLFARQGQCLL